MFFTGWRSLVGVAKEWTRAAALFALIGGVLSSPTPAVAQADPNQGPGGPILVLTSGNTNFGRFYAEILRTEGFNAFTVADISTLNASLLSSYDVVVLAKVPVTASQATTLTTWVNGGGNLITMDPASQLHSLAGITTTGQTLSNGYLRINTATTIGSGIVGETMQFHGSATRFTAGAATTLATLYSTASTATSNPAVTLRSVGSNGGQVATFAYDLATSIVYTRQGNPAWAGQERDGSAPIRAMDMFVAGPSEPSWIDLNKIAIPQADEQQRFFANLITSMNLDRKPLPRFWYFPKGHKAIVIMTGDDHSQAHQNGGATLERFNQYIAASRPGCSVADWECIRGTSYLLSISSLTDSMAASFEAQGFEVGLHITQIPNSMTCANYTPASLADVYQQLTAGFFQRFPSLTTLRTQRHHCVVWSDWATGAKVQLQYGMRLDTNYYWSPQWPANNPGHFTGSAMPMRFADTDGSLIDVYQAVTQMHDEGNQPYPYTPETLLDRAIGVEEQYGAYTVNAHIDVAVMAESDTVVQAAQARGVPVVSAKQMLTWLDGRNSSSFGAMTWSGNTLSFSVVRGSGANGLTALIPRRSNGSGVLSTISRGSTDVPFEVVNVKGVEYAMIPATAGSYTALYAADGVPPTIAGRTPGPGASGVNVAGQISIAFSEPMDASTIGTASIELRTSTSQTVPASVTYNATNFTATIIPSAALAYQSTYSVVVRGGATDPRVKDLAGNALASTTTWSFSTATDNCPCSIWSAGAAPMTMANDGEGVNLGVKFTSDVAGYITGVRFYKVSGSTGTNIGYLWTQSGQLLASATFSSSAGGGWQQVNFASPVAISANTTYVASYFVPDGRFGINPGYFSSNGADSNMLHAPGNGMAGGNGVFAYGAAGSFPNSSWNAANYWADVVFTTTSGGGSGGDVSPPVVTISSPTTSPSYAAASAALSLSGTASDNTGVTQVSWSNDRGGSGNATGTTSWSIASVALQSGTNLITVTARDAAGNTSTDTLAVTYTPPDTTAPVVTINGPTGAATYSTSVSTVSLSGSATDAVGVTQVSWTSDRGGSGIATGTASWSVASIALATGANVLTVTARDAAGNASTDVLTVTYAPPPTDTTPPMVLSFTPAHGATGVSTTDAIAVNFSEPMNPATITSSALELRNASNVLVAATVSYSGTTALIAPAAALANATTYTVTVRGGASDPRVKDVAGNALAATVTSSFTTAAAPPVTTTIWPSGATPSVASAADRDGVEVGVRFTSDVAGYITGIRFFKGPANTGVHVGNLWTAGGQRLATATFVNETASGWQQVNFATPVAIAANTTYIASYHAPNGGFSINVGYFGGGGFDNGVVQALASNASEGNGVFIYGAGNAFPAYSWGHSNYWVDVVFTTTAP